MLELTKRIAMVKDMKQRTFSFAINTAKLLEILPMTIVNRVYLNQLIRSSSSIGANYRASQRAKSSKDFINKLKIVEEEADESIYFLELLFVLNKNHQKEINILLQEAIELLKIIVASINTVRKKMEEK